jgi:protein SCO1/2
MAYGKKNNIQEYSKWKITLGIRREIYNLGRKFILSKKDLGEKTMTAIFLHTENFVLIKPNDSWYL